MMRGKKLTLSLLTLSVVVGLAVWQRDSCVVWWRVRALAQANPEAREECVHAFVPLGESAMSPLLSALQTDDETACRNLEFGLRAMARHWQADDPRALRTMEAIRERFARLSVEGKNATLHFAAAFIGSTGEAPLPAALARTLGDVMAAGEPDDRLRPAALALAGALVERAPAGQWQAICRGLALKGLADASPATRVAAIQLVLREPLRKDGALIGRVTPFLRDSEAGVRRVALVALGTNTDVVREEDLLPLLHDADAEIQHLCEVVLRSRGLSDSHVRLARYIGDANPAVRMQVLPLLRQTADLDVDVWLRRLTLDPAPAVRAAAARFAGNELTSDLRRRLDEMAQTDPSPTVREIAQFYIARGAIRNVGQ